MQRLLKTADVAQLRYGGGSSADTYDWRTNSTAGKCIPTGTTTPVTSSCSAVAPLDFGQFSQQARAIDAESFVTVNYGSGTPAQAAAWVAQAKHSSDEGVALWEVGNEPYGCWEVNNKLSGAPTYYQGYQPLVHNSPHKKPTCPQTTLGDAVGTQTLATSYAANAQRFLQAMKAADPSARIGVPWAFDGEVPGAFVPDSWEWNTTVLQSVGKDISFVDVHYYPWYFAGRIGGTNPTIQQVLLALQKIPSLQSSIRSELNIYAPNASVVVGETGVSSSGTTASCTPLGALFAAGDALSWLAAGAQSVDWWAMNSNGPTLCGKGGTGFFATSVPPAAETPYYGYLLASILAKPHALMGSMGTSDPSNVLAFQSALPGGKYAVAFINTNTGSTQTVTYRTSDTLSGTLRTWSYSAQHQNASNSMIVTGTTSAAAVAHGVKLPAESITVLQTQ